MSAEKIRALNDTFRTTMTGGKVFLTAGVDALPYDVRSIAIRRVATCSDFTPDNDSHGERSWKPHLARDGEIPLIGMPMQPGAAGRPHLLGHFLGCLLTWLIGVKALPM